MIDLLIVQLVWGCADVSDSISYTRCFIKNPFCFFIIHKNQWIQKFERGHFNRGR